MDVLAKIQEGLGERYRVLREIGAGGMAYVYLAEDLKHHRQVALKLLRPELAAALGPERFLSEIRVTASLQHPHLVPLFDSGEVDGLLFYVMPYIPGESLDRRLARERQLPLDDAVRLTVAVASALHYAHRQNVIHRDLKPANILLHDGEPFVTDFGIALAISNAGAARMTQTGWSMGTPQYMSPEQATGERHIDARSDIYSLGAVLYEMLSGEPPHGSDNAQRIVARVLSDTPRSLRAVRPSVPEHVDAAVQRALARVPADRFTTAQQFADALLNPHFMHHDVRPAVSAEAAAKARVRRASVTRLAPWLVALAGFVLAAYLATRGNEPNDAPIAHFAITLPPGVTATAPGAVSRSGETIVFSGVAGAVSQLYIRDLDANEVRELPATAGASMPFFSPDGATVGYFDGGGISVIPASGAGQPTTISRTSGFAGAAWVGDEIIYGAGTNEGLWRVSVTGDSARRLTSIDSTQRERAHAFPHYVAGANVILFTILGSGEPQLALATLDGRFERLGQTGARPQYVSSGHILFTSADGSGTLLAAPFDPRKRRFLGQPQRVLEGIRTFGPLSLWTISPNGVLVFSRGDARSYLVLVDRQGHAQRLTRESRVFRMPRFSPDGNRIAVEVWGGTAMSTSDIWLYDQRTEALSRFTSGEGNIDPVWTPDGRAIAYSHEVRANDADIVLRTLGAADTGQHILTTPGRQWPWSFTPDGQMLVYDDVVSDTASRIMALDVRRGSTQSIVETRYLNVFPRLSPDGKWLAYSSNESGRMEVYVTSFPSRGAKVQVSIAGGNHAAWSRDGSELFYRNGRRLYRVAVVPGSEFAVASRSVLFESDFDLGTATNYDVSPDGRNFVMLESVDASPRMVVYVNFLNRLAGIATR